MMTANEKFNLILERYDIHNIWIAPSIKYATWIQKLCEKLPYGITVIEQWDKEDMHCLALTGTREEHRLVSSEMQRLLTEIELKNLINASDDKFDELPQFYYTLENSFQSIAIVHSGAYSEKIIDYYKENPNLVLKIIDSNELSFADDKIFCESVFPEDTILIMPDLWPDVEVYDGEGKKLVTFINKKIYKDHLKITEYLYDVNERLIPYFISHGVKVVKVYATDITRLSHHTKISHAIKFWQRLRHYCPQLFEKIRSIKFGNSKLQAEMRALINDNSKGYSEVIGNGKYINFDNGFRRTIGNHTGIPNAIYMFGPCFVRGIGSEDAMTIPSKLKKIVGNRYNVLNYGSTFHTVNLVMRHLEYKAGDIVVLFTVEQAENTTYAERKDVVYLDLTDTFEKVDDIEKHIFDLPEHFDSKVEDQIVQDIFESITASGYMKTYENESSLRVRFGPIQKRILPAAFMKDINFNNWLEDIYQKYYFAGKNGAIVMNCNPFTNGHRYLIEIAASQVEHLYIFVVQENRSEFSFEDRYMLVKKGTEDLKNVVVLPSGQYVISSSTLPGYFEKATLKTTLLDATQDLRMFMQIANRLDIIVRFAGEEPLDPYTKQYNENMERTLPAYGISFQVIKRKEEGEQVISASRVRKALKEGDFNLIKRLVPPVTYDYLCKVTREKM